MTVFTVIAVLEEVLDWIKAWRRARHTENMWCLFIMFKYKDEEKVRTISVEYSPSRSISETKDVLNLAFLAATAIPAVRYHVIATTTKLEIYPQSCTLIPTSARVLSQIHRSY